MKNGVNTNLWLHLNTVANKNFLLNCKLWISKKNLQLAIKKRKKNILETVLKIEKLKMHIKCPHGNKSLTLKT